jgi:3-dehydrosphinganine reductase
VKDFNGKLVLITGGSSGIGLALAKKLAALGANIWILARRQEQLQAAIGGIEKARSNGDQKFGVISADVTDMKSLNTELDNFRQKVGVPDLLVNSAGYSHPATFGESAIDEFHKQMDVNYFGTVYGIRAILPGMVERGSGYIVNVSSIAAFLSIYGFTAYSASKFAVLGLTDGLRSEVKHLGIKISLVVPPDTDTPMLAKENEIKPEITKIVSETGSLVTPEVVADAIIKGIKRERALIMMGFENSFLYHLGNFLGSKKRHVLDYLVNQARRKIEKGKAK